MNAVKQREDVMLLANAPGSHILDFYCQLMPEYAVRKLIKKNTVPRHGNIRLQKVGFNHKKFVMPMVAVNHMLVSSQCYSL
jgi:hypothetical protein